MSLLTKADKIDQALGIAEKAFNLGRIIVSAVRKRQWKKVDRILSGELKTSLARAEAYAKAADRFDDEDQEA